MLVKEPINQTKKAPEWVDKLLASILDGEPLFELIDLFCGAGGLTEGAEQAEWNGMKLVDVIACVNHDPMAIKSHSKNHPNCLHFTEDIRALDVHKLPIKRRGKFLILHASLECTNFSNAKGGQSRDADSRTLANHLFRYVDHEKPDYVTIENVREFMAWGPMRIKEDKANSVKGVSSALKMVYDKKTDTYSYHNVPEKTTQGEYYLEWVARMKSRGYEYHWKLLNAADYGAYTSRVRYFGIFSKKGLPVVWPQPTHAKKPPVGSHLKKWKAVRDVLELETKGESIFNRKKPLSENTLKRIYAGLVKYVANGDDAFIKKYFSGRPEGKVIPVSGPSGTITTIDHQTIVQPQFIKRYNGGNPNHKVHDINEPMGTILTNGTHALVSPEFMVKYYGNSLAEAIDKAAPTLTTKDRLALVNLHWLNGKCSGESNFLDKQYSSGQQHQSIDVPAGSITTVPKLNVVQLDGWVMDGQYKNTGKSLEEPASTVLASRKQQYLMNPQWGGNGKDIDSPAFTLIARMDKAPPYLMSAEDGAGFIVIYDSDSETMKKIKLFMTAYGIIDIKMRMLLIPELKRIQGFPEDYILEGTKTLQKKFIGNAVVPVIPKVWYSALGKVLLENYSHFIQIAA